MNREIDGTLDQEDEIIRCVFESTDYRVLKYNVWNIEVAAILV